MWQNRREQTDEHRHRQHEVTVIMILNQCINAMERTDGLDGVYFGCRTLDALEM